MSQTAEASGSKSRQRLSTPQTLHLMRLEVENALKHGYAISCLMLGLDGFVSSDLMLHRRVLMPLIFRELKAVVFERQVRGLGIWTEGFELAVFPHVEPGDLAELADELRARVRELRHESVPEDVEITISVGISHNQHPGEVSFETVVQDAESGLQVASASGGDQVSRWRDVESELDRLKEELDEQLAEIELIQNTVFGQEVAEEELWSKELVDKVIALFQREPDRSAAVVRLQKDTVALLKSELEGFRRGSSASQLITAHQTIQQLERRVAKLTDSLTRTEGELKRVASMKDADVGVASLYRTVQGLADDDENAEAKHEMLKNIFEANVALRQAMAPEK